MKGAENKQVSWIQDLKSVANGGKRHVLTQKRAPAVPVEEDMKTLESLSEVKPYFT